MKLVEVVKISFFSTNASPVIESFLIIGTTKKKGEKDFETIQRTKDRKVIPDERFRIEAATDSHASNGTLVRAISG